MSINPYLAAKREAYTAVASAIEGIQTRAANEDRDLTAEELRSIKDQTETAKNIHGEIELLTDQENRTAAVAEMGANLRVASKTSTASAVDRDPGHYRSVEEGGQNSFLGDLYRSRTQGDEASANRLREHNRSQTTATVDGVVPPQWLTDLFTTKAQQDASLYDNVAHYAISDARVIQLPGQTANTTIAVQTLENDALVAADAYDAAVVNVTPTTLVAREDISRQLLDAGNPGIDALLVADLTASYVADRENRIGTAIRAVGTSVGGTLAQFNDHTNANFGYDLAVDAAMAVRSSHFRRPSVYAMDYQMFGHYLKLSDGNGRPIVVGAAYGPQNAIGEGSLAADGYISGIPVVVSEGMNAVTNFNAAMVHGPSVVVFESPQMNFRFEEVAGPQTIRLGLWRYFAVSVRNSTRPIKNVVVTP